MGKIIDETINTPLDIQLAFFDIDGTLLGPSNALSSANTQAIQSLNASGVKTALATGRPYFAAEGLAKTLSISAPSVFFSGALVINPNTEHVHLESHIPTETTRAIIQYCRKNDLYLELYPRDSYIVDKHLTYSDIHALYLGRAPETAELLQLNDQCKFLKAVIVATTERERVLIENLTNSTPEIEVRTGFGAMHPEMLFANIASAAASRQKTFELVTTELGIPARKVISFGDAEADLTYFRLSGISVAMGNASESVKANATYITKCADDDGVGYAINKLLRNRCLG